jgi:hypothetical protein
LALVAFLKVWILRPFVEEILKRLVQVYQLLGMATGNRFIQPKVFGFLNFGELSTQCYVVQPLFVFFVRLVPQLQPPVPHPTGMAKFNRQLPLLLSREIESEFVDLLCYHNAIVLQLNGNANDKRNAECTNRLRVKEITPGIGGKRKSHTLQSSRDCASYLRKTRICRRTSLHSFKGVISN